MLCLYDLQEKSEIFLIQLVFSENNHIYLPHEFESDSSFRIFLLVPFRIGAICWYYIKISRFALVERDFCFNEFNMN